MNSYVFIPAIALGGYGIFLFAFMAARRTKLNNAFILVLVLSVLWTGGSFCMRMRLWPSEKFWYDVSLFGLLMMAYGLFYFGQAFVGEKKSKLTPVWLVSLLLINIINIATGFFLEAPKMIESGDGQVSFVYHVTWTVGILFAVCALILIHMMLLFRKSYRTDEIRKRQLRPILLGILCLFIGQLCLCVPVFKGFPIDVLSAFLMVIFMSYALYRRRLFKLTLLVSKGSCYIVVMAIAILLFSNVIVPLASVIRSILGRYADNYILITAVLFTLLTFLLYYGVKKFVDGVFIKDELVKSDALKEFSENVSRSLEINQVLKYVTDAVRQLLGVQKVFIFIADSDGSRYDIAYSASPLDSKQVSLKASNPIVVYLKQKCDFLFMDEFRCLTVYKSMWESEKKQIRDLGVEVFLPLRDGDFLIGFVAISAKEKNGRFTYDDIGFLSSISSIGSIAVKNSRLYEKAYAEARTDDLTGLLNRKCFYQVLQEEFEKNKDRSLALIILNLDDFKLYNQLYGYREGDLALQRVARIITASVGNNGYTARYSGKEFAVILPGYDLLSAKNLAENIRRQIMDMNKAEKDYTLKVLTVSGGISSYPYAAGSMKELVDNADMAVYQVKRRGKNAIMLAHGGSSDAFLPGDEGSAYKQDAYSEYASTIYALTAAIDTKDHYTFNHSKNVAYYAASLAAGNDMGEDFVELIREAGLLHDIGKIGIPEDILNKPGKLTEQEYEIMKGHVENSVGIIRHLPSLDYVIPAVIGHHERYDGKGYPRKISGEDIPLSARILCIADSFDAMVSRRSYKTPYSVEYALEEIQRKRGSQFDPKLADLFVHLVETGEIVPRKDHEPMELREDSGKRKEVGKKKK